MLRDNPNSKNFITSKFITHYLTKVVLFASLFLLPTGKGLTQEIPPTNVSPQPTQSEAIPEDELFFADIIVRGQPIFQIGSLSELSATERAEIVNRRIASILAQSSSETTVTVVSDRQRGIATLQSNNRILMTVTQQDAQDFNLPVETLAQQWADELNQAFEQPPLAIDVGQRLFTTLRQFQRDAIAQLPALLGALLAAIGTWLLAVLIRRLTLTGAQHWEVDRNSKILIGRLVYGSIWVLGTVVALGVLGLDFTTLLGTLGLTSVAIGFSLRDVLSNYLSGIILLASRPFRLGDQIVIQDFEGTVTQIQLRATTIKTYDGRIVSIPNQEVFSTIITNNTACETRRSSVILSLDYGTDIRTTKRIILEAVLGIPGIETNPPPDVLVRELAANTVNIEVRFWVDSRRLSFLEMTSQVAQAIKEALQRADIQLPNDIYTVELRNFQMTESDRQINIDRPEGRKYSTSRQNRHQR
jgi:small conductance mechanosensitive channel